MKCARLLLACLVAAFAASAVAQTAKPAPAAAADPAAEAFKAWDKDRNGSLSPVEFRAGWQQVQRVAEVQARLRHQFSVVDANDNGGIDAGEYGQLLLVKNAGKAAPPLARFDANADGKLEYVEYLRLVKALAPKDKTP